MTTRTLAVGLLGALLSTAPLLAQTPAAPATPAPAQPPARQPRSTPAPAAAPAADEPTGAPLDVNLRSVDFGVRITDVERRRSSLQSVSATSGPARSSRDSAGPARTQEPLWRAEADNVGYRDQRYSAQLRAVRHASRAGSSTTRFPTSRTTRRGRRINAQSLTVAHRGRCAADVDPERDRHAESGRRGVMRVPFELRTKRDITTFGGQYAAGTRHSTSTSRSRRRAGQGHQPWGASFGVTSTNEVPAPIDQRNNEIDASVEWSNRTAMLRAGYDGSFFNTETESIDLRQPAPHHQHFARRRTSGRTARLASSTMHTISATGSMALPAKSRLIALRRRSRPWPATWTCCRGPSTRRLRSRRCRGRRSTATSTSRR